jgi:general secretion pathway protein A
VDRRIVEAAAAEVFDTVPRPARRRAWLAGAGVGLVTLAAAVYALSLRTAPAPVAPRPAAFGAAGRVGRGPVGPAIAASEPAWRDEADALRALARLWGAEPPAGEEVCAALKPAQLQCLRSGEGLAQLRLLGRPALLMLQDGEAAARPLLLGLDGQQALLREGGQTRSLGLLALSRQWRGDFITLWRTPPGYPATTADGPLADWLDQQLRRVLGDSPADDGRGADALRAARVAAFQRSQGLRADGRAGPITLMQLNRVVGIDEPRLRRPSSLLPSPRTSAARPCPTSSMPCAVPKPNASAAACPRCRPRPAPPTRAAPRPPRPGPSRRHVAWVWAWPAWRCC